MLHSEEGKKAATFIYRFSEQNKDNVFDFPMSISNSAATEVGVISFLQGATGDHGFLQSTERNPTLYRKEILYFVFIFIDMLGPKQVASNPRVYSLLTTKVTSLVPSDSLGFGHMDKFWYDKENLDYVYTKDSMNITVHAVDLCFDDRELIPIFYQCIDPIIFVVLQFFSSRTLEVLANDSLPMFGLRKIEAWLT